MPTSHTWKPHANGYILDPANYVDGTAFAEGDTLIVHDGVTDAVGRDGGFGYLRAGRYQFEVTGLQADLSLKDIGLTSGTTLSATGPGLLVWSGEAQFVNDGRIEAGSAAAPGDLRYDFALSAVDPTFTNNGRIALRNASSFVVNHLLSGTGGTFLNAPGALLSVASGSGFVDSLTYRSDGTRVYDSNPNGAFRNDGTIVVNGTPGRRAALKLGSDVTGNGTISVRGASGDDPSETYATFFGSTHANSYVSNGTLIFSSDGNGSSGRLTAATGSVTFLDAKGVLDIEIGPAAAGGPVAGTTQNPFGAVIHGFQAGNVIKLTLSDQGFNEYLTYDQGSQVLSVLNGSNVVLARFTFAGSYQASDFHLDVTSRSLGDWADITTTKGPQSSRFEYIDTATGAAGASGGEAVDDAGNSYLQWQYIDPAQTGRAIITTAPNVFLKAGAGTDALAVVGGINVLDGGTGSNFLVGGTGADGGTDTFFTDARGGSLVWNTLANFGRGDAATLWGFTPGRSTYRWDGIAGAPGYEGATLRADIQGTGREDAAITFSGLTLDQASRLVVAPGVAGENPYLYFLNPGV